VPGRPSGPWSLVGIVFMPLTGCPQQVPPGRSRCWRIVVQRHGGDLRVTSTPGDTRFQVLLPTGGPPTQ
jgi:nitrogen-specific signal transduction histidine kinase